jgi:hypothetical protein
MKIMLAKAWLNTGYKNIKQEIELCPVCGQALNKSIFTKQ